MKRYISIILGGVLTVAVFGTGWTMGKRGVLLGEYRMCESNLRSVAAEVMNKDLREYLKARYYFLSNRIPSRWRSNIDFGPPDTNVLKVISIGKESAVPMEEYRQFKDSKRS